MMKIRHLVYPTLLFFILFCCLPVQAASVRIFSLSADTWARPRSGEVLPQMEALRLAVDYWHGLGDAAIMLRYPSVDSGELWAAELKDWLVSLGIPSRSIYLSPGLHLGEELRILVGHTQELEL